MLKAMAARVVLIATFSVCAQAQGGAKEYRGICEVSAGTFLDAEHFVVASDETNILQMYKRSSADPTAAIDLVVPSGFNKSDLEGAARIGDRVYWISSHSFNSGGEDKKKRKVLLATKIMQANGSPTLQSVGAPVTDLRDGIASAANVPADKLNIEGLAATPDGQLLIGLRGPLQGNLAIVITLTNPAAVVEGAKAIWGARHEIDLHGLGIRSMDLMEGGKSQYLIAAGSEKDSNEPFKLFKWPGAGKMTEQVSGVDLGGLRAEAIMQIPGTHIWFVGSDDGDICSDEKPTNRRFRSLEVKID